MKMHDDELKKRADAAAGAIKTMNIAGQSRARLARLLGALSRWRAIQYRPGHAQHAVELAFNALANSVGL